MSLHDIKKTYAPKDTSEPMNKIKGINASMLPPCFRTLTQTIKRVQFVSSVAKGAHRPTPSTLKPAENGYLFRNDKFQINWFEGSAVPDAVWKVLEVQGESDDKEDEDEDLNHENDELVYGPDDEIEEEDDCDDVEDD